MKYCQYCGKEIMDAAMICVHCGCPVPGQQNVVQSSAAKDPKMLLNMLAERVNTNAIIWLVIGILQILGGIFFNWFILIVGVLNTISSVQDMKYSKKVIMYPAGIVGRFEPLTGPIITLIYNVIFGGVIGVIGSIYYFVAIRNFVMENRAVFAQYDMKQSAGTYQQSTASTSTGGWRCSCGRGNAAYVSTCVCGKNKNEVKK